MKRTRNLQPSSPKVRAKKVLRNEKTIREWEADGWTYELCQRASGDYVLYAVETDGDGWRIESGATIKACLQGVRQPDAEVEALLAVEE